MTSQLRSLVPVLTLWRSSNFLDPVEKPVGGPSIFTLNHLAFSPALCRRCEHLQSIHDVTQLPGTYHKSPFLKCHLRRPCSSPRRFSSGLSLRNRWFLLYLVELRTKPRLRSQISTIGKTWFLVHLQVPELSDARKKADGYRI